MAIDTKRLASDPGYWDEVAPEGAELFVPGSSFEWRKWLGGIEMFFDYEQWLQAIGPWSLSTWLEEKPGCIPRPQKPEVEWDGSEMVKAGHRLEARAENNPWLRGEIMYRSEEGVVFRPDDGGCELFWRFCMFHVEFRPIRTREQRQRDELEYLIESAYATNGVKGVADAMQSTYNLEPKDV